MSSPDNRDTDGSAAVTPASQTGLRYDGVRRQSLRRGLMRLRIVLACVLFGIALTLSAVRLSLPAVDHLRPEVQQWVSSVLERSVTIEALGAHWRGWTPVLDIRGLRLLRTDSVGARAESALTFEQVQISIDTFASLRARRVVPHSVELVGASFSVMHGRDGSLRVAGMGTPDPLTRSDVADDVARWLLRDGRLIFDSTTVNWTDESRSSTPLLLTNVRVQLLNQGERHRLTGSFRLPGVSHNRIDFLLDARGDLVASDWNGELLLSGNGIDVAQLGQVYRPIGNWAASGRADISFRGIWHEGVLDSTESRIRADGLTLSSDLGALRIHEGAAQLRTGTIENGLSADIILTNLHTSEGPWKDTRGSINYLNGTGDAPHRLVGRLEHARLADIVSLFKSRLPAAIEGDGLFAGYRSNADLENLHFTLVPGDDLLESLTLTADFGNLSVFNAAERPNLTGFSGRLEIDGKRGVATLEKGTVDVALSDAFQGRFLVDTRGGRIAWNRSADAPRLDVYNLGFTADGIQGQFTGSAQWDETNDDPQLSLVADVTSGDVAALRRYIPAGVLSERLVSWIRRGIVGGRITRGSVLVHGRMADFPFDSATGMLQAEFNIADGELDYAPGWPALAGLTGQLRFDGRTLTASIQEGRIFDTKIDAAEISLKEIGKHTPVIVIRGTTTGDTADGLKFINDSPLRPQFENQLRNFTVSGKSKLTVALDLPLGSGETRLQGKVSLEGNSIDLPQLESGLEKVEGVLEFDAAGVRARDVSAVFLDRAVGLEVATSGKAPRYTEIRISGKADNRYVARHLVNVGVRTESGIDPTSWLARLKGEAPWLAVIQVPTSTRAEQSDVLLRLESGLKGMHVDFPYPVGKAADASGRLSLAVNISEKSRRKLRIRYGDQADAVVELLDDGEGFNFRRGMVSFGGKKSELPAAPGLYINGHLPELVAGDWIETWRSALKPEESGKNTDTGLRNIGLDIDRLTLLGASFQNTRVEVTQTSQGTWTTQLKGEGLDGAVLVPRDWKNQPILANFERIDYRSTTEAAEGPGTDPRDIPSIQFTCKNMTFDGRDLGVVKLVASSVEDGLDFETIYVVADSFETRASGRWQYYGSGRHRSEFSLNVHSEDLGEFLSNLGFGDTNAAGGATDITIDANWAAAPMAFDLVKLNGRLHFRSTKGKLLGVKRRATARIFGLLTVTTLPRRLSLDFTDLFEKGVSYEIMEGTFNLENGQAYTNNMMMENATARVDIVGRTGLAAEDYDQMMTVTPKLSSSLPLAPIWLVEKFLNRRIFDRVFSYKYTVTGSWDDPKVDLQDVVAKPAGRG